MIPIERSIKNIDYESSGREIAKRWAWEEMERHRKRWKERELGNVCHCPLLRLPNQRQFVGSEGETLEDSGRVPLESHRRFVDVKSGESSMGRVRCF